MNDAWIQEARKLGGANLVDVITELRDGQRTIIQQLGSIQKENEARDSSIAQLKDAFPANDYGGHRRYHEILIAQLEEQRKFRITIKEKFIISLLWMFVIFCGMAIWDYVKSKMVGHL